MEIALDDLISSPFSEFSKNLKALCLPFFKQFNLNYFDYARIYPNGSCWSLFTNPNYVDYFTRHPAYSTPPFLRPTGRYLWAGYIPPEFLDIANEGYNYYHGLTLVTHTQDYVEIANLAAPASEFDSLNLYLNHVDLIQLFIKYVVTEVMDNQKHLRGSRIVIPSSMILPTPPSSENKVQMVIDEISTQIGIRKNHHLVLIGDTLTALSQREKECLNYLKLGFCNKLIARTLNISHRTVEKYFEKIYLKSNLNGRRELLRILMR